MGIRLRKREFRQKALTQEPIQYLSFFLSGIRVREVWDFSVDEIGTTFCKDISRNAGTGYIAHPVMGTVGEVNGTAFDI